MDHEITEKNNPDILATGDTLRYMSDYVPAVGDTLTFQGHTLTITSVKRIRDYPKHDWEVGVEGEGVPAIRELLTYRVGEKEDRTELLVFLASLGCPLDIKIRTKCSPHEESDDPD